MPVQAYYTPRSSNRKTGNIPQQFVGLTRQESKATCHGCPLLASSCYAHRGTENWAHSGVIKAAGQGKDYSLATAIRDRHPTARYVRFGAIGDPSGLGARMYRQAEQLVRDAGLGVLSYTHFWRTRGKALKGHAMASCETWEQVELATSQGWRAAVHVPGLDKPVGKTASGKTYALCPAQKTNLRVQCNACGLCDATHKGPEVIVFLDH
jgi:hypothetical protein